MARPSNNVQSLSMTITVSPQTKQYLEDLVLKGTHGATPAEIARKMINDAVNKLIADKLLAERQWRVVGDGTVELV